MTPAALRERMPRPCMVCGRRHPAWEWRGHGLRLNYYHDAQSRLCVVLRSPTMTAPTVARV